MKPNVDFVQFEVDARNAVNAMAVQAQSMLVQALTPRLKCKVIKGSSYLEWTTAVMQDIDAIRDHFRQDPRFRHLDFNISAYSVWAQCVLMLEHDGHWYYPTAAFFVGSLTNKFLTELPSPLSLRTDYSVQEIVDKRQRKASLSEEVGKLGCELDAFSIRG